MNRQTVRIIQFTINSILIFVTLVSQILGFLLFVPLALAILFGLLLKNWSFFWNILIADVILIAIAFCLDTLTFKIADIFGKYFKEHEENEKILEEYESWFEDWYQKEYEKYERARQEQQNHQRYGTHYSTEDIIEKFEQNLKVLGLDSGGELSLQTIKKAHRTKAKEFHPDKNPGKDTTADMQRINAAKEYLDANLEYYLSKKS